MSVKNNIPNFITSLRIIGTICILFLTPLETPFFIVYTFTGVTDALDGFISRLTHTTSEFGAKLDSIADLIFYTVSLIKLFPVLWDKLPGYIWIAVGVTLVLRIISYTVSAVKFRRFASLHTMLNKITGVMVFAIPYFIVTPFATAFCIMVCISAFLSTAEELYIHISSSVYKPRY